MARLICSPQPEWGIPALYLHDLTGTTESDRLLSVSPPVHPTSSSTLNKLRRFDPVIAESFKMKPGPKTNIPFKLITEDPIWLQGRTASFIAVSYCWHADDWEVTQRLFSGSKSEEWSFPISPVMLQNILLLKDSVMDGIWIDQVCIDQDNEEEKANAVQNMDTIYRSASDVIILLEDVNISMTEEEALGALIDSLTRNNVELILLHSEDAEENLHHISEEGLSHLIAFTCQFFSARWFSRAWCIHEYQLNANRTFLLPGYIRIGIAIESQFFTELQHKMDSISPGALTDALVSEELNFGPYTYGTGLRTPEEMISGNMFEVFRDISKLDCSVLSDKISIALNITGLRLSFHGSLVSEYECNWLLALISISAGDASVLGCEGKPLVNLLGRVHQTWLRWPTEHEADFAIFASRVMPKLHSDTNIQAIELDAITLDILLPMGRFELPSQDSCQKAASFLASYLRILNYPLTNHSDPVTDNLPAAETFRVLEEDASDDTNKKFLVRNLACSLSCGITWMTNALGEMGEPLKSFAEETYENQEEELKLYMWHAAVEHLFSEEEANALQNIAHAKEHLVRYLYFLLNPTWYFLGTGCLTPWVVRIGRGNTSAIYLAPDLRTQYQKTPNILAIPAALNTTNAIGVRRAWLLQEAEFTGQSISLQGKGYFYGCGALQEGHGDTRVMLNVRVVGPSHDSRSTSPLFIV
jgi:hypothetical protein